MREGRGGIQRRGREGGGKDRERYERGRLRREEGREIQCVCLSSYS